MLSRLAWARELKYVDAIIYYVGQGSRLAWARELKCTATFVNTGGDDSRALRGRVS